MKIAHVHIGKIIDFDKNNCYSLVIENSTEFFSLTNELYNQTNGIDGNFVLSENKILDISKYCLFIHDYYSDVFNSRKITTILNNRAMQFLQDNDFYQEFGAINKSLLKINEKIIDYLDVPNIKYNDNFEYKDFLSFSNYKIERSEQLIENLVNYIDFFVQNAQMKIVVFVNLFSVLDEKSLIALIKQLKYMQINVLLIDNYQKFKIKDAETIIIDNDLCLI